MRVLQTIVAANGQWVRRYRECRKCFGQIETRETILGPRRIRKAKKSTVQQIERIAQQDTSSDQAI
jgi:transcriptional regulator NrdR family protein